jgi:hypothetical protein
VSAPEGDIDGLVRLHDQLLNVSRSDTAATLYAGSYMVAATPWTR